MGQRRGPVEGRTLVQRQIADEDPVARVGRPDRGGRRRHAGQRQQRGVDLAQLDPAAADLDLVVRATDEGQAVLIGAHQVTAAVRPRPAQGGHRREPLPVERRVEVVGQPDAADHQLADLAGRHPEAVLVHHREVPPVERPADAHRLPGMHPRTARDHRGLGRAVGVPHLALPDGQPVDQLGWARLAAEDEQPHGIEGGRRPQRREGRHGGDDGDPPVHQPRREVHAAADQGPRRRDEAGAVAPGQPHLLARGVERDGESGQHAVARPERSLAQEEPGLGVDERRGRTLAHRNAFRRTRRSRGEDDPRIVIDLRWRDAVADGRLATPGRCAGGPARRRGQP